MEYTDIVGTVFGVNTGKTLNVFKHDLNMEIEFDHSVSTQNGN